ncbi:unnamed protein product [Clonostachys rosea f. rosea IK726]|uniref:Zn(2)-C6 fungal-type domain-containing protein n=2 Tax=Bionectria ochroleuca TaxID=29856 RepID=A0A0B7K3M9_BIOOC|nr:unnamed protein product [Clonostachys rosea f. rosea IK726]
MPRPKLLSSQRQRAAEACNACREAKKRCSGTAPCTHCLRRGLGSSCFISHRPRGNRHSVGIGTGLSNSKPTNGGQQPLATSPPSTRHSTGATVSDLTTFSAFEDTSMLSHSTAPVVPGGIASISPSEARTIEVDNSSTIVNVEPPVQVMSDVDDSSALSLLSMKPSPRMLLNLRGERVYIGGGGSLSFLQAVRGIISAQVGPSQFSRHGKSDTMLEKESPQTRAQVSSPSEMKMEDKLMYAKYFYEVTGGLIDPFCPQEMEQLLTTSGGGSPQKRALVQLIIAVGLQCDPSADAYDRELAYFSEAQAQAFSGMLEDPDIDMVRIFLIMSFYLLGECRRNTAFMYLGIAARAALSLGLHSPETYTDMKDSKHQLRYSPTLLFIAKAVKLILRVRLRVWMSLRVMDIPISSILGRPPATAGVQSDLQGLVDDVVASSQDRGMICLVASYKMVSLISNIVEKLYDRKEISIPMIEENLQELEKWSQGLPQFLRTSPSQTDLADSDAEKSAIGRVHVSCLYYFAVTLVTRPILVSTLIQPQIGGMVHSHLASACLDAAIFIVQTCSGARKLGLLKANMATIISIIFPAGLVLGFQIFAKDVVDYGIESAFHGARELLNFLGAKSSQATLYYDILTSLSNVINERREKSSTKSRTAYVSKLFNFERQQPEGQARDANRAAQSSEDQQPVQMNDLFATCSLGNNTPLESGDMFLDWDSLDISLWESFPYLT